MRRSGVEVRIGGAVFLNVSYHTDGFWLELGILKRGKRRQCRENIIEGKNFCKKLCHRLKLDSWQMHDDRSSCELAVSRGAVRCAELIN